MKVRYVRIVKPLLFGIAFVLNVPSLRAAVPLSKDAAALAEEIHGMAQSEEGPSAIETRLTLAEMVKNRDRQYALRLLGECVQGFAATKNSDAIAELVGRAMELYLELAPNEAEALARSLPGRSHPEGVNAREFAYDGLVDYWRKRDTSRAEKVLGSAFGAGAFRVFSGQTLIRSLLDQKNNNRDPSRALGLFAQFMAAFRENSAAPRDILFLIESAVVVLDTNRLLANQAIEKALAAVQRRGFEEDSGVTMASTFKIGKDRISIEGVRKALLFQIATYLKEQDPDAYHDNREAFQPVQDLLDKISAANFRSVITAVQNRTGL